MWFGGSNWGYENLDDSGMGARLSDGLNSPEKSIFVSFNYDKIELLIRNKASS